MVVITPLKLMVTAGQAEQLVISILPKLLVSSGLLKLMIIAGMLKIMVTARLTEQIFSLVPGKAKSHCHTANNYRCWAKAKDHP